MSLKKILSSIGTEFVYGGHLLSLGATGIVLTVILLFNLPAKAIILIIPYLISQVVYTYNHVAELDDDKDSNPERAAHLKKQKKFLSVSLSLYVVSLIILSILTNLNTFLVVAFITIGGVLYTAYFKKKSAKYFIGFKNFYTSFFWGMLVFLVPTMFRLPFAIGYIYMFLFVFLRWIVNSAFFDIKDIESDKKANLKTFAVVFGKKKAVYFLQSINILALLPLLLGVYDHNLAIEAVSLIVLSIYGFYYLYKSLRLDQKSLRILSYVVVDAEYIFWPLLILIGRILF